MVRRRLPLLWLLVMVTTACGGATVGTDATGSDGGTGGLPTCADGRLFWEYDDSCVVATSIDLDEIISGGPPPDGIPPIDDPVHESVAAAADWLEPQSPVMVIEIAGDMRAYPLAIMTYHEIVNDVVGDVPVAVTYCPLCNSGLAFDRRVGGEVLDFGTSGRLRLSNLVMYDRQTKNLWGQFDGEAIVGSTHLGTRLGRVPTTLIGFEEFRAIAPPDARVLSRETGASRPYGRNPYAGYDREDSRPFLYNGSVDERLPQKARVVGIALDEAAVAVHREWVEQEGAVTIEHAGATLGVVFIPGAASALDREAIDESRRIGGVNVFELPDGATIDAIGNDRFRVSTGEVIDAAGHGVDGSNDLVAVAHDDTFWFVWFAFLPDTALVGADGPIG